MAKRLWEQLQTQNDGRRVLREVVDVARRAETSSIGQRVLWVAQWSGWEEEMYAVVEVPRDLNVKTLFRTQAGRCW